MDAVGTLRVIEANMPVALADTLPHAGNGGAELDLDELLPFRPRQILSKFPEASPLEMVAVRPIRRIG